MNQFCWKLEQLVLLVCLLIRIGEYPVDSLQVLPTITRCTTKYNHRDCHHRSIYGAKKSGRIQNSNVRLENTKQYFLPTNDDNEARPAGRLGVSSSDRPADARNTKNDTLKSILNAALLIAGTTVGGGFLALPTVVAPNGFAPSAAALVGVWAYFLMESFVVVECLVLCRQISRLRRESNNLLDEKRNSEEPKPGIAAAAKIAFGPVGESTILILLVLLIEATLVSQISRAGVFFPFYRIGCAITAISVAGLVFGTPQNVVTGTNSLLTSLFCVMAVILFGTGSPAADWSKLVLFSSWTDLPQAIPTFLQLLVYCEILPAVCQILNYRIGPIRWAILIGSFLPLVLEVGWAALGIGLLPLASGGNILGTVTDPVNLLLAAGPVQVPLFALAVTAIATTIIGSYLALQSAVDDVFPPVSIETVKKGKSTNDRSIKSFTSGQQRRTFISMLWIVLPALGIASISPNLFLQAIDFAGSYPVILLWGLAPPAIAFRLRSILKKSTPTSVQKQKAGKFLPTWCILLATISSSILFAMSAIPDVVFLAKRMNLV